MEHVHGVFKEKKRIKINLCMYDHRKEDWNKIHE